MKNILEIRFVNNLNLFYLIECDGNDNAFGN